MKVAIKIQPLYKGSFECKMVFPLFIILACFSVTNGLNRSGLYPYGPDVGDHELVAGDNSKDSVELPYNFVFYRQSYRTAFVSIF